MLSKGVVPALLQETPVRVRPSEEGPRQEGPVAAAVAPGDAPGVAAERARRRAHRRSQAPAAAQGPAGGTHANPGGSQQTAGVPTAPAQAATGTGASVQTRHQDTTLYLQE